MKRKFNKIFVEKEQAIEGICALLGLTMFAVFGTFCVFLIKCVWVSLNTLLAFLLNMG